MLCINSSSFLHQVPLADPRHLPKSEESETDMGMVMSDVSILLYFFYVFLQYYPYFQK